MIKIIVDSTCDIPTSLQNKYQIQMIPLRITVEGKTYEDKKEINTEVIYNHIKANHTISTSLPSYENIYSIFKENAENGQPFIFLSFSSKLSGTYQFATEILNDVQGKFPDVDMAVVDTLGGALGIGLIAMHLARYASDSTHTFKDCLEKATNLISRINHFFLVGNLSQLAKGGRITLLKAIGGNMLNIKPILNIEAGEIKLLQQVHGTKRALKRLAEFVDKNIGNRNQLVGINYSNDIALADKLEEVLQKNYGIDHIVKMNIGSVLSSHIGLEAVGVFFFS